MTEYQRVVVYITAPREEANRIARVLVEEKLAACANIVDRVSSIYWWEGRVEEDEEALIILKTELGLVSRLVRRVKEIHPYSVPEVIALPIIAGNPDYLVWISESIGVKEE